MRALAERALLHHARVEMRALHFLPQIVALVLPMACEELEIDLNHRLRGKLRIVQNLPNVVAFSFYPEFVRETDQRDRTQRRAVVLRPAPRTDKGRPVDVELRFPEACERARFLLVFAGKLDIGFERGPRR